ncbi:MAG TPA: hypothetical protein DD649_19655 [Providencia sp.]|uniref:hypothetical protein n=1 Tax=Providencia sp. TaxID=589 RepID=UPI000E870882|nr:hypothetical protein [Providencia sp.]
MKDSVYIRSIEVITTIRDLDSFSVRHVEMMLGYEQRMAQIAVESLLKIGCIKKVGKKKSKFSGISANHYKVDDMAITRLKEVRGKVMEPINTEKEAKDQEDILCGMKIVKKAFVSDMGNQSIKHLDQLLAGVRA